MIIGAMGDLHLRDSSPRNRVDDYPPVLLDKFKFILDICDKYKIQYLIQPGDFFDTVTPSYNLVRQAAFLIKSHNVKIFVVYGQHDLRFHYKDTSNTPLRLLEDFGFVTRLFPSIPVILGKQSIGRPPVYLWGSSWREGIPEKLPEKVVNIWATHRLVVDNDKLWPGAKDYYRATHLLQQHGFSLIVSGDNHKGFTTRFANRCLVNCGSLGRTNIDQAAHVPFFVAFDTEKIKIHRMCVPIASPKKVLKVEEVRVANEKTRELHEFAEGLKAAKIQKGIKYKSAVMSIVDRIKDPKLREAITFHIKSIFEAAESDDINLSTGKGYGMSTRSSNKSSDRRATTNG